MYNIISFFSIWKLTFFDFGLIKIHVFYVQQGYYWLLMSHHKCVCIMLYGVNPKGMKPKRDAFQKKESGNLFPLLQYNLIS